LYFSSNWSLIGSIFVTERKKHARPSSPYTISLPAQIREVLHRRVLILKGNISAQLTRTLSFIFQAIIMGTIFVNLKEETSEYFSRGGILFFSILFGALSATAEISALFAQRPIVGRHAMCVVFFSIWSFDSNLGG
jgi:ATP-binding cassette, subfamily G (WHITE), member 2, SNQ2